MLDINPILLISTMVVFGILIAILNSSLYNPLFSFMTKRDNDIKNDLDKVGSNDDDINTLHNEAKKIVIDAKLEAATLREKVLSDAKALADSKIESKRVELANEYAEFEQALVNEREQLKTKLLSQVPLFKEAVKAKFSQI